MLSSRLQAIADLIQKYKQGDILADIGSDHAYLPCYLVKEKIINQAYACEVAQGPMEASVFTIEDYHLKGKVIPLLGNGLSPIVDKSVDMISICGMGGKLMIDILEAHKDMLESHLFILQPNVGIQELREYLYHQSMEIIDEVLVEDYHHIYTIMVCQKTDKELHYTKEDLFFGPCLRKKKDSLFHEKYSRATVGKKFALFGIPETHSRYKELKEEISMIEGELNES